MESLEILEDSNYIEVSYLITNGEDGNGISEFDFVGKLTSTREANALSSGISFVSTNTTSFGGATIESVESVKKYATQFVHHKTEQSLLVIMKP